MPSNTLVNTRFGKQQYCASMTLGVEIDTSVAQKAIDELDQRIRDTVSFELIRNGVPFIKDATIASGAIHAAGNRNTSAGDQYLQHQL